MVSIRCYYYLRLFYIIKSYLERREGEERRRERRKERRRGRKKEEKRETKQNKKEQNYSRARIGSIWTKKIRRPFSGEGLGRRAGILITE